MHGQEHAIRTRSTDCIQDFSIMKWACPEHAQSWKWLKQHFEGRTDTLMKQTVRYRSIADQKDFERFCAAFCLTVMLLWEYFVSSFVWIVLFLWESFVSETSLRVFCFWDFSESLLFRRDSAWRTQIVGRRHVRASADTAISLSSLWYLDSFCLKRSACWMLLEIVCLFWVVFFQLFGSFSRRWRAW